MTFPFDRGAKPEVVPPGILTAVPADPRTTGLTYEPFYGLKEKPFSLTSDARFFYQSRSHAPAFDSLLHSIKRRESLAVLTGDIGTGKTTLCRAVLQGLDRKTFSAFVTDPFASREELLKVLLMDFGVASVEDLTAGRLRDASRTELSYLLYEFLGTLAPLQAFAVVLIDEAQNLSLPLLEEIRILSDADGQLQVILVGQLEFREKLKLPQMRQLDQRVSVHCRLDPLDVAGVSGYISHRLHRAGGSADRIMFSGDAVERVYELSAGVPRLINKLCDRALDLGHSRKVSTIDAEIVTTANCDSVPPPGEPVIAPMSVIDLPSAPQALPLTASASALASFTSESSAERRSDSVDTWLAGIEDKAAAAAKAKNAAPRDLPDPIGWRERWTPTDAVRPVEPDRRLRYRIRVGAGRQSTEPPGTQSSSRSRQFVAVVVTMIVLLLAAVAGPWMVRTSARLARYVNAQFSAPPPPPVAAPPRSRIALPNAPRVPEGPY